MKGFQIITLILFGITPTISKEEALPQNPALSISKPKFISIDSGNSDSIQAAINAVSEYGVVQVNGLTPTLLEKPIVINRNNVWLKGAGSLIKLKPQANEPIIVMGDLAENPEKRIGLKLSGFFLDGSKDEQQTECSETLGYLMNNGVSVRNVHGAEIFEMSIYSCASGGIVLEKGCREANIYNIDTYGHVWDGIAACDTTKSRFKHIHSHDNKAAFSFDWHFDNNFINECAASDCEMAVFMRNSNNNYFNIKAVRMSKFPVFIAQHTNAPETACSLNYFKISVFDCAAKSVIADFSCNENFIMENGKSVFGFF